MPDGCLGRGLHLTPERIIDEISHELRHGEFIEMADNADQGMQDNEDKRYSTNDIQQDFHFYFSPRIAWRANRSTRWLLCIFFMSVL
jgi:hypothetical protein